MSKFSNKMYMEKKIKGQIKKARAKLENSDELIPSERIKIYRLFGESLKESKKLKQDYLPGHKRRTILQKMCVEKVLPIFKKKYPDATIVEETLEVIERYLKRGYPPVSRDMKLTAQENKILLSLGNADINSYATLAGWACSSALSIAIFDTGEWLNDNFESFSDAGDDADGPEGWRADYCASLAYADGPFNTGKIVEFWHWYLDDAVLAAYNSVKE